MNAAPMTTAATPIHVQRGSPTMKLLPWRTPVPWPIQTRPAEMRTTPPTLRVRCTMASLDAMLAA